MFDIIGDVHGQLDKLVALLTHLGYRDSGGAWRHPSRSAIFVGDLIDRGPKQLATVDLVRRMVEAGSAQCVMGNHEFNAIAWATADPEHLGEFLRPHRKPGNLQQHQAFLSEVEGTPKHDEVIAWFKTLPLWLDLGGLRIVHACWHQSSIDILRAAMGSSQTLTDEMIVMGSRKDHPIFKAIEMVCKGPEVELPPGVSFKDKEGKVRTEVRVRWWQEDLSTYRKAAIGPPGDMEMIPDLSMPAEWVGHPYSGPAVLFGHYWFTGKPTVISPRFACLDYSAARDGPLVAYRWDGESELSTEKFAWVGDGATEAEQISFDDFTMGVSQSETCIDCESRLGGEDHGRDWHLCKFCGEAVCEACEVTHYCERQRSMKPNNLR
jgi:Calcineurin-like phosphoesterase